MVKLTRTALAEKNKDAEIFAEIPKIYDAELRKWSRQYGPRARILNFVSGGQFHLSHLNIPFIHFYCPFGMFNRLSVRPSICLFRRWFVRWVICFLFSFN